MMESLIESRADQIGHSGIRDQKLSGGTFFYVCCPRNERATRRNKRPSQLEMKRLIILKLQVLGEQPEVGFKIGNGAMVGMMVIDPQATSYIDDFERYAQP